MKQKTLCTGTNLQTGHSVFLPLNDIFLQFNVKLCGPKSQKDNQVTNLCDLVSICDLVS